MTQLDNQTKEIGGFHYTVTMLDPLMANDLLIDIMHVVGPSLGASASAFATSLGGGDSGGSILDSGADPEWLDRAISGFFSRVTKDKMRGMIDTLAAVTTVRIGDKNPQLKDIFSAHFRGRLGKLYEWLAFALRVQGHDFFGWLEPVIASAAPLVRAAVSPSPNSPITTDEPPTSTGS